MNELEAWCNDVEVSKRDFRIKRMVMAVFDFTTFFVWCACGLVPEDSNR
jgi:hypothetical protein